MIHPRIILLWAWGSAMSAVTRMLHQLWYTDLIAIDKYQSQLTHQLQAEWISVSIWHGSITVGQWDVVIASAAAIGSTQWQQAEILYAADHVKAIPPLLMHEFLGELSKSMKTIAITGTHGKSTTTALAGKVFAELDPEFGLAVLWAGLADRSWANYCLNPSHLTDLRRLTDRIFSRKAQGVEDIWKRYTFLIEADEYNKHMLYYDAHTTLITTLSHDHVDIYPTREEYFEAFRAFVLKTQYTVYGLQTDDWYQSLLSLLPTGRLTQTRSLTVDSFDFIHLIGWHNHANATLVYQAAVDYGLDPDKVRQSIESFSSLWRRAETIGTNSQWCQIISDYAHHPSERASTYSALVDKFPDQPLHIILQPHQAQRLLEFRDHAVTTLQQFNSPVVYQIYAAREDVPTLLKHYQLWGDQITDWDTLGQYFATQCWATYMRDTGEILTHIDSITEGVIVLFSAGNLDYIVRSRVNEEWTGNGEQ